MSLFGSISNVIHNAPRFKKRRFDPEKMTIDDIILPEAINDIDPDKIRDMIKNEVNTYKALGYKDKPLEQLKVQEYHSYQIGLMLKYIKEERLYLIPQPQNVLPSYALNITKRQLHVKVFDVVYRYVNAVNKEQGEEKLKNELKWSPLDAAYLLCYLNTEEKWLPKKF